MDVNTDQVLITGSCEHVLSASRSLPGMLASGNFLLNVHFLCPLSPLSHLLGEGEEVFLCLLILPLPLT